jgi:hypothetical protein
MTPKEKAIEIYDNFYLLQQSATDENGVWFISALNKGLAKKCALIAVDEIIDLLWNTHNTENQYRFYKEVKTEIEKL